MKMYRLFTRAYNVGAGWREWPEIVEAGTALQAVTTVDKKADLCEDDEVNIRMGDNSHSYVLNEVVEVLAVEVIEADRTAVDILGGFVGVAEDVINGMEPRDALEDIAVRARRFLDGPADVGGDLPKEI